MYGNGSDGALNVTSGTTNLNLNQKYQYTTVNVSVGATLSTSSTTGSVLYILATTSITIAGTINVSGIVDYGNNTWGVTLDGQSFSSPGTGSGGVGGSNIDGAANGLAVDGFGGGGAGGRATSGFEGGDGGNGSATAGTGGAAITATSLGSGSAFAYDGNNGGASSGGGGGSEAGYNSGTSPQAGSATSGAGGNGYGANGGNASTNGGPASAGGGGGAGGRAGRAGVHVVLKAPSITISGTIITSGTNGSAGGNGGTGANGATRSQATAGSGGGGGGGGKAGNVQLTTASLNETGATYTMAAGTGGSGGLTGYSFGTTGQNGTSGSKVTTDFLSADMSFDMEQLSSIYQQSPGGSGGVLAAGWGFGYLGTVHGGQPFYASAPTLLGASLEFTFDQTADVLYPGANLATDFELTASTIVTNLLSADLSTDFSASVSTLGTALQSDIGFEFILVADAQTKYGIESFLEIDFGLIGSLYGPEDLLPGTTPRGDYVPQPEANSGDLTAVLSHDTGNYIPQPELSGEWEDAPPIIPGSWNTP